MDTLELPVVPADTTVTSGTCRSVTTEPHVGDDAPRRRPRFRAPLALRAFVGLIGAAAGLFAAGLMLSDRAPGFLEATFGETAQRLWDRIDADQRELLTSGGVPETDSVVHVLIWAGVAGLLALTLWTWRGLAVTAAVAFGASVALELGQGRWSTTRAVELRDVAANGVGVTLGVVVAGLVIATWNALGHLLTPTSRSAPSPEIR